MTSSIEKEPQIVEVRLPTWFACPLVNDDWTGCTDEEQELIRHVLIEWLDLADYHCTDVGEDVGFQAPPSFLSSCGLKNDDYVTYRFLKCC